MSHSGQSPTHTPATIDGMSSEIDRLQRRVEDLRRVQAASRWTTLVLLLIIVAEFAVFVFTTRQKVVANFNDADIKKAINERLPRLTPQVRDRLVKVAQNALPVYRDQAMARLKATGPGVARDALDRLQKLPQQDGQEMARRLETSFEHVLTKLDPEIRGTFPTLNNEQKTRLIHEAFMQNVQKQNEAVAAHITQIYAGELARVKDALDKFDLPKEAGGKNVAAREREFLHTLVDVMMDSGMKFDIGGTPAPAAEQPAAAVQPQASAKR